MYFNEIQAAGLCCGICDTVLGIMWWGCMFRGTLTFSLGGAHVKLNGGPWVSKVQQNTYI